MIQLTRQLALFKQTILNDTRSVGLQILRFTFALALGLIIFLTQNESSGIKAFDGLYIFQIVFTINIFFAILSSILLFLPIIREEKEECTLGMILMTGISPFAYLFGRISSRYFIFIIMLSIQLPIIFLCITMGGISIETILLSYFFLLLFVFHIGNIFLLASMVSTSFFSGIIISGGIFLILSYLMNSAMDSIFYLHNAEEPFILFEESILFIFDSNTRWNYIPRPEMIFSYFSYLFLSGVSCFLGTVYFFDSLTKEQEELELPNKLKGKNSSEEKASFLEGKGSIFLLRKLKTKRFGKHPLIYKDFRFSSYGPMLYILQFSIIMLILYECNFFDIWSDYADLYRSLEDCSPYLFLLLCTIALISSNLIFASEIKNKTLNSLILLPQNISTLYWIKLRGLIKIILPTLITISITTICYSALDLVRYHFYFNNFLLLFSGILTLASGILLNSFLSITISKFSFLLSIGLTLSWFFLQSILFQIYRIRIYNIDGFTIFTILSSLCILTCIPLSIKNLKKHSLTS